ncbi:hypothetical protein KIPB_006077 [Kipferlia bialata]|uniref:Uncharacterized protein n=1 Tax=Kipferlia bialata TaxID=797122 RepID=A0A391P2Z8_9EUKA|nr:hypothetical protein KIPB_006077 [Kipferlia bialata]|eukprot:g6077.t1
MSGLEVVTRIAVEIVSEIPSAVNTQGTEATAIEESRERLRRYRAAVERETALLERLERDRDRREYMALEAEEEAAVQALQDATAERRALEVDIRERDRVAVDVEE